MKRPNWITTQKELIPIMQECYKTKKNTWHNSKRYKGWFYWSANELEGTTFPEIYTRLSLLKKVSQKLYGHGGSLIVKS